MSQRGLLVAPSRDLLILLLINPCSKRHLKNKAESLLLLLPFFAPASEEITLVKMKVFASIHLDGANKPLQAQQLLGDHLFLLTLATALLFVPVSALNAWHQPPELGKPRADSVPFP